MFIWTLVLLVNAVDMVVVLSRVVPVLAWRLECCFLRLVHLHLFVVALAQECSNSLSVLVVVCLRVFQLHDAGLDSFVLQLRQLVLEARALAAPHEPAVGVAL